MTAALQNAKGPASVGALPDRGSTTIPVEDKFMNVQSNTTRTIVTASGALDPEKIHDVIEDVWADILTLQRKAYLLMGEVETSLDPKRGKVDDTCVTLMFRKREFLRTCSH